jgi:exodeoxyribonuclease III
MKLITWNCQGAFRKKAEVILLEKPDVLVVQECEHPDKLKFGTGIQIPNDVLWIGDNVHKGLAVFSYGPYNLEKLEPHNEDIKFVLPIAVAGEQMSFVLLAIWANHATDPDGRYVEQVWKAIHHYEKYFVNESVILTGDFNSNTIWDRPRRIGNHSEVVARLAEKNIHNVYHRYLSQEQGKEKHPTFFLHRDKKKSYHLDYCFVSESLYGKVSNVEVGKFKKWIGHSDHLPVVVEFKG